MMRRCLNDHFTEDEIDLLKESQAQRIEAQYYIGSGVDEQMLKAMISNAPSMVARCNSILSKMTGRDVELIQEKV